MPYLYNSKLRKMTDHEDIGLNKHGKRQFKCKETGIIRGYSKNKIKELQAKREVGKEKDLQNLQYEQHGISSENTNNLREFLNSRILKTTPNVTETKSN